MAAAAGAGSTSSDAGSSSSHRKPAEGGVHGETPYVDAPFEIDYDQVPSNGKVALISVG